MTNDWMHEIDNNWSLFLDRDGVINVEKEGDYIRNAGEFRFIEGVLEAFPIFARIFRRIFVVTNQKGVGKGLMTPDDLEQIHNLMSAQVAGAGGRLDKVYYCTALDDNDPCRKPNPGMGLQAQQEFPGVSFSNALMIGNAMSDMKFGKALGMRTIFIPSAKPPVSMPDPMVDAVFPGLLAVAKALQISKAG